MGYTTTFEGVLHFTHSLTPPERTKLETMLEEDMRRHPEWQPEAADLTFIDYEITQDGSGLQWNGSEKSYDMVEKLNFLLMHMRREFAEFGLEGFLDAQGEEAGDVWRLSMKDGYAVKKKGRLVFEEDQPYAL